MSKIDVTALEPTIATPGTPFEVGDSIKDTTFSPGTVGMLSYIVGPDYNNPNVVFHKVLTTRRGKRGKERFNVNVLLSPIFTLPGVEMDWLIPTDVERKHLVDMTVIKGVTKNMISPKLTDDFSFLVHTLSRALLTAELDKAVYPSGEKIMQTVGLPGHKEVSIWPNNKTSMLKRFVREVESSFNEGNQEGLYEYYCNPTARVNLLKELQVVESCLVIPRLEYQRKVAGVMLEALDFIKTKLNDASKTERPDKSTLLQQVNFTRKIIKSKEHNASKAIDTRLEAIVTNRKVL
jgi:hypothetical protein